MQHVFLHRGPSRVFWFLLGTGVATWWHYAAAMPDHRAQFFPCMTHHRRVQEPTSGTPPQEPTAWSHQRDWEQDRDRLSHLQKRAGETVADLSESTLESIISGAESLKTKLAQLRTEREQLEAEKKAAQSAA